MAFFIKSHHHRCSTVASNQFCTAEKLFLTVFETDGVDDRFSLRALQSSLKDFPLRTVDHDWDRADVGFARDESQVLRHRFGAIQERIIHVDIDDARTALHLIPGDFDRFLKLLFADQSRKLSRARHIRPLADHEKIGVRSKR